MGIRERKERHEEELRTRILEVAEGLFVDAGYGNVSMRKIAAAIEYSPTTIYRHFESKAAIMNQLMARGYQGVRARYQEILASQHGTAWERFAAIIRGYVDFALEHPNHYELWFATGEMAVVDGELRLRHGELEYAVYEQWLRCISGCQAEGLFTGLKALTVFQMVWAAVHGLISLRIRHPAMPWMDLGEHLEATLTMIRKGLDGGPRNPGGRP